jgi:prepilin-type N-terminal cleavage/methylation domain-containing protein
LHSRDRRGFTLVEMLVVISIIGVLAAILVPTIGAVMSSARVSTMALELSNLEQAIEAYKLDQKDYPPDFSNMQAVEIHMRAAYPRNTRVVGGPNGWLQAQPPAGFPAPINLDPAEALVFWLSGLKNNPRDPLAGTGEPKVYYTFAPEQLTDVDSDGWKEYASKYSQGVPYVYFDGRIQNAFSGGPALCAYAWAKWPLLGGTQAPFVDPISVAAEPTGPFGIARPYRSNHPIPPIDSSTFPNSAPLKNTTWLAPGKFQIISPGLDGSFGPELQDDGLAVYRTFPSPNYSFAEDADNLATFSEGRTMEDMVP